MVHLSGVAGKAASRSQAKTKPAAARAEKRKSTVEMGEVLEEEYTVTGRRKRKDLGAKREGAAKGWTEEEERLFLEGLELYGREWHKAAAHVGMPILHFIIIKMSLDHAYCT